MGSTSTAQKKMPHRRLFADLRIGSKLGLGFGVLVVLIFLSAVISFYSSAEATRQIQTTETVRVPAALLASRAQADLLRMLADVRGYLFLGDSEYRNLYQQSSGEFESDLSELNHKSSDLGNVGTERLDELQTFYSDWEVLPEQLFELRDDQLDREPAYAMLATDGVKYAGNVIVNMNQMISQQGQREPTAENLSLMSDMANFQGNFSSMLSALRGYVTTRNRIYRGEYEVNLVDNENAWRRLKDQSDSLTASQQDLLKQIEENRDLFLAMPDQIFEILESDELWRKDLSLFTTKAVPVTDEMNSSLNELVLEQQQFLQKELGDGRQALERANNQILITGILALVFALAMWYLTRQTIALPVSRLTSVAEQISGGDLDARALVESRDEIGVLAYTFNTMTAKLSDTLFQVRKEKKRADDLLEVVIPIGVELSTEKDFNRLLEKMVLEAKSFCRADTGILYMITPKDELDFVIIRSDSLNLTLGGTSGNNVDYASLPMQVGAAGGSHQGNLVAGVASKGETLNLQEYDQSAEYLWGESEKNQIWREYSVNSLLAIPLKNSENRVLGVLELINPQDVESSQIIDFDPNLQQMMESFSSLAVAALEAFAREQKLKQEIQQLRIEINQNKREKQVSEIVESDFFKDLSSRADEMRLRITGSKKKDE